jgi:3-methylcrotonyl-CoA carboxylase beta subunit
MPLHSTIDPTSSDFARNAEAMRALVAELRQKLDQVAGGGGEVARVRHTSRGKMLARQRVDLLIDPGAAFLAATCIRRVSSPGWDGSRAANA